MTEIIAPARGGALPRWWFPYALVVSLIALLGLGLGVNGIYSDKAQNEAAAAANKAANEKQAELLDCFNDFATDLAGGLPPLRAASAARDDATGARDDALQRLVAVLVASARDPEPTPDVEVERRRMFGAALTALAATGKALDAAQADLEKVRAENPYPEAPSTYCDVEP